MCRQPSKLTRKENFRILKLKYVLALAWWNSIDHDHDVSTLACDYSSTTSVHVCATLLSDQKSTDAWTHRTSYTSNSRNLQIIRKPYDAHLHSLMSTIVP